MKTKLTVSIDKHLIPAAKEAFKKKNISLSSFIEDKLRDVVSSEGGSFADRWCGAFELRSKINDTDIARYSYLKRRYKL